MTSTASVVDRRNAISAIVFTIAIFANATLLFAVQPMFTKLVLPRLGGTTAVWNTCLLFFQAALLGGYLYAHIGARVLSARTQALVHLGLLFVAMAALPIGIPAGFERPMQGVVPIAWLIGLLVVALGAPFTLVAAGAPILQRWFAATDHPRASNPYFLYAASNLGSFVALMSYPFLIEPNLRLVEQRRWWSIGYLTLMVLIALCALIVWRTARKATATHPQRAVDEDVGAEHGIATPSIVPNARWRLRWVLLSFVPSSLLVGVTTFISTDIAAVPLLWVIPLALYLLTFVLVFARQPPVHRTAMLWLQLPLVLVLLIALTVGGAPRITLVAGFHLLAFFVTAMVCHRELADSRPRADYLTGFYLWIAVGGVLGGVFNVLLAPLLYNTVREYPYALILALGLRPALGDAGRSASRRSLTLDLVLPALLLAAVFAVFKLPTPPSQWGSYGTYLTLGAAALIAATFVRRPLRLALGAAAILVGYQWAQERDTDVLAQARSFFGVYRVKASFQYHVLTSGTTTHGGQNRMKEKRTEPLTYYHRGGPLGQFFASTLTDVPLRRVAAVGLGAGTVACYGRPEETWTFFEIDPVMVRIANSPQLFTYMRDCPPETDIVVGDARLSLATMPDSTFDLILLDAFSSDAIPVHLLTREALAMYMRKLRAAGIVLLHISNRYLELRPVVVELARDARLAGAIGEYDVSAPERLELKHGSRWVALARSPATLASLVRQSEWRVLEPRAAVNVWTDDFSDVLSVLRWRR